MPEGAQDFSRRVHGLMDGQEKDEVAVNQALEGMEAMLDAIAAGMYSLASIAGGRRRRGRAPGGDGGGECGGFRLPTTPTTGRKSSRRALAIAAIELLERRKPGCLAAPGGD